MIVIIQNINTQVEQMTDAISQLEVQCADELPSYTVVDQKEDESEIVLGNGNKVETPEMIAPTLHIQKDADNINIEEDIINIDNDILYGDDIARIEKVFDQTDKKLENVITNSL